MAKEVRSEPAKVSLRWLPWAMLATALLGGTLAFFWHRSAGGGVAGVVLPARPDLTGRPAELGRLLLEAETRVKAEKQSADSVAVLGRIYHVNGFLAEARACWLYLRALQPQEARWCYYLSDLSALTADEPGLRSWLEETVRLAPDYAPAWLELAQLEFKTGRLEPAERAFRQRLELVPGDPHASLGLARVALQADRRTEGRQLIEDLVKRVPEFPSSHNMYAEILAQEGDQRGAANQRWQGMVAGRFRAPDDAWKEDLRPWACDVNKLIVWGAIDFQTKHGDRGKAYFERAVRIAPENPQGYENLGMLLLDTGSAARAAEILEQGSVLPHASEQLFTYLGNAYLALRQPDKALAAAERGLGLMPGSSSFLNLRGLALAASDRPDDAIAAYREAMKYSPSSPEPLANLGLLYLRLGRQAEAVSTLKEALELQPAYSKALTPLAYLEMGAGDLKAAAGRIFPFFQQFPGQPEARALMSRYHLMTALEAMRRNDYARVEQVCQLGLGIVPESAELHGFLGMYYRQRGRTDEALKALEASYALQPADPRVSLALADLYIQLARGDKARPLLDAAAHAGQNNPAVIRQIAELRKRLP